MPKRQKIQYTVRDIPESVDTRLRETAAMENISLNQAALRGLERGLGLSEAPVRYRSLRSLLGGESRPDRKSWDSVLGYLDQVDPEDWK